MLCRFGTGHFFLTHLMPGTPDSGPHYHPLLREQYYNVETRKELLEKSSPYTIFKFPRETGLFFLI